MKKKRKSKELKEKEEDLLFYLEYWKKFPNHFQKIAQKEIDELEDKIKNDKGESPAKEVNLLNK